MKNTKKKEGKDMENMAENSEKIWKIRRKASWIMKRYEKYGRKVSWIVKWHGKYRIKLWKDMENMEERQV